MAPPLVRPNKQEGNGPIDERQMPNLASDIAYMVTYDGLLGYYSLQTTSEVKSDLIFEISDLNHLYDPSFKVHLLIKYP